MDFALLFWTGMLIGILVGGITSSLVWAVLK